MGVNTNGIVTDGQGRQTAHIIHPMLVLQVYKNAIKKRVSLGRGRGLIDLQATLSL